MLLFVLIFFTLIFNQPVFGQSDSPTPTVTPTPTSTTITPTPTFTQNPYLTEVVPNPSTGFEWVEIYNPNNTKINLSGWIIGDSTSSNRKTISNLEISPNSYATFEITSSILNNNDSDYAELWNGNNSISRAPSYPSNIGNFSWSRQSENNWCATNSSKNSSNNSCITPTSTATSTPAPTPTSTVTPTKASTITPTVTLSPTPTKQPTPTLEVAPTLEPTNIPDPMVQGAQVTSAEAIGSNDSKPKGNNLGIIFIVTGGLLLLSPLIITKIQQWKEKSKKI